MAERSHHLFDAAEHALPQIRQWLRVQLGPLATSRDGYQFIMAVDELCANIIEHADQRPAQMRGIGNISVEFRQYAARAEARITYGGEAFDPTGFEPEAMSEIIRKGQNGGLGLRLISRMHMQMGYFREDGVNVCILAKRLRSARALG